ncbi:DUF6527 family protein [Gemmata sp.]|uniref:DUF6527 family protein n=1 Tax=Gemmata sp. TaxID=1914242 RepID=UPI003F70C6FC
MTTIDPKRTVPATRTGEAWPEGEHAAPGAVFIDTEGTYRDHLLFACPGCGRMGSIGADKQKHANGPSWQIVSGELVEPETLTLSPSINCVGCCGWHGFLTAGVFKSC